MTAPTRPVLRYHGGKWRLASWIIKHFPAHCIYVEPFGGGCSVLAQKPRSMAEIYNDVDEQVVNVFRIIRDPDSCRQLVRALEMTPYSRAEWEETYSTVIHSDAIEHARRAIVRTFMGHGTKGATSSQRTGFHTALSKGRYTRATSWATLPPVLADWCARLHQVTIECADWSEMLSRFDGESTLFYCDPPYRGHDKHYRHRFPFASHDSLLAALLRVRGMVVLSGYPDAGYDQSLHDWTKVTIQGRAFGNAKRTEVLWLNPACAAALANERHQGLLEMSHG